MFVLIHILPNNKLLSSGTRFRFSCKGSEVRQTKNKILDLRERRDAIHFVPDLEA